MTAQQDKELIMFVLEFIIVIIACAIIYSVFMEKSNRKNPQDFAHYGEENYTFVTVKAENGKITESYNGSITVEDYNKWLNGESGTLTIYSTKRSNTNNIININYIISIVDYGCEPRVDDLPKGF